MLRSGMGAQFRVPIINDLTIEQILAYLPTETRLLFADKNPKCGIGSSLKKYDYNNCLNQPTSHVTLVIGGETTGISSNMYGLASLKIDSRNRSVVGIPIENGIESLNCATAFGILGYEIRKNLLLPK